MFNVVNYATIMKGFQKTMEQLVSYASQQEEIAKNCELTIIAVEEQRASAQAEAVKATSSAQKIKDMFDL